MEYRQKNSPMAFYKYSKQSQRRESRDALLWWNGSKIKMFEDGDITGS